MWVRAIAVGGTPLFVGHGERAPKPDFSTSIVDIPCDVTGTQPLDAIYSGENCRVSVDLVRYNMSTINAMRVRARGSLFPAAVPGTDLPGMLGSLMVAEGCAYELWLRFGSGLKPTMNVAANGAMGAGYHFYAAVMDAESDTLGSVNAYKIHFAWKCYRIPDWTQSNSFGFGAFGLYDFNMSALNGLSPN